jgi:glycosyltransferase involved in cell wall biosynthesis
MPKSKPEMGRRIRLFSPVFVYTDSTNAQSLNVREIALRLDPRVFEVTFYYKTTIPDARLMNMPHIRLKKLPSRLGSLVLAYEMIWGKYDILFYLVPGSRDLAIYWQLHRMGRRKKIVTSVEGSAEQLNAIKPSSRAKRLELIRRSHFKFGITDYISESMSSVFGLDMPVLPIGVDLRRFHSSINRSNHDLPIKVLFVGSIQPRKQPHLLLELAKEMKSESVEFHIIGKPADDEYYSRLLQCKEKDQLNNVLFHGSVPNETIQSWMEKCDMLILPSRLEGMPKVTMEAAATGLPCIILDDYHTPSVVDGVTGFQVKTFDEMQTRLRQLVADPELRRRMGKAATTHIQQFDWDRVALQWSKMFQTVFAGKHKES